MKAVEEGDINTLQELITSGVNVTGIVTAVSMCSYSDMIILCILHLNNVIT